MSTLGHMARTAVLWNTGFSLFRDLLQFGVTVILVRLLTPESYGQFGLVTTTIGFLNVLSCDNFIAHTLQVRRDEDVHYQDHFTAGGVIQVSLCLLSNVVAVTLHWVEAYAAVAPLVHVMSIAFLLDWPSGLRVKMLERALDWKRLRLLHGAGLLASSGLSLGMAAGGWGVYALLVPGLVKRMVFIGDLFVAHRWRPTWAWSAKNYTPARRFGLSRMSSELLVSGRNLAESSLFVHLVGFTNFGMYGRAIGLAQVCCYKGAIVLMQGIYPVLTRIKPGTDAYAQASELALRCVAWLVIPIGSLFAVLAEPVIRVIYGDQWLQAVPLLPWAMAAATAGAIAHVSYMLMLANQQHRSCMLADLWTLLGTGISLLWLLPKGMAPYLIGSAMIQIVALMLMWTWLYDGQTIAATVILTIIMRPLIAVLGALVLCEAVWLWIGEGVQNLWTLCAYGTVFSVTYLGILRLLFASQLGELVRYLPGGQHLTRLLALET